ncbi:MAG: hypothetical protein ABEI13_04370 [Candidatus Paceibacteria bacterium]
MPSKRPDRKKNLSEARAKLDNITYTGGILSEEIEYINVLLDLLETYYDDSMTDITEAWEMLHDISEITSSHKIDMEYGHDYRPAFIYILSAQRIKNIVGQTDAVGDVDRFVDIAIRDVLKPSDIDEIIDYSEIKQSDHAEEWKLIVPDFITRQIQDVEQEVAGKRPSENHKSQLKNLTGIFEEFMEVLVSYLARCEYGDAWQNRIAPDGNASLNNYSEFICGDRFDSEPWQTEVCDLLWEPKFGELVMEEKEGTIVDLRNDFAHNNVSHINEDQMNRVKNHIERIVETLYPYMPVLGVIGEENKYQAHLVRLLRRGPQDEIEIQTNRSLKNNHVYFFPQKVVTKEMILNVKKEQIQPCKAEDIVESINSHSDITITEWSETDS